MVYVPSWVEARWRREYQEHGSATVSSPDNANSVALYAVQAVLGVCHLMGWTGPTAFVETYGAAMVTPWALAYISAGVMGWWAVLFMQQTAGRRMRWAQPELVACLALFTMNTMYVVSLAIQLSPPPLITLVMTICLGAAAGLRTLQIMAERVKTNYLGELVKAGTRTSRGG